MLSFRIALRYLFSRSRLHAVNYVTAVSALAIAVVSMALVCVLSIYNGYIEMILEGTEQTDAALLIRSRSGKTIDLKEHPQLETHLKEAGVKNFSFLLESKGLLRSNEEQWVVDVVGIDHYFPNVFSMAQQITSGVVLTKLEGQFPEDSEIVPINIGAGITLSSSASAHNGTAPKVELLFPKRVGLINPMAPSFSFSSLSAVIVGQYSSLSLETDHTVYIPIRALRSALDYTSNEISAIALHFRPKTDLTAIKNQLETSLGDKLRVLNREEQHPDLSYLIRMEKIMTFLILLFILLLAAFNVASSLMMLILEKQEDARILYALGAHPSLVGSIYRRVGLLISLFGSIVGVLLGVLVCYLQERFGLITAGVGSGIQPLPVDLHWDDLLLTFGTVTLISYLISLYPTSLFLRSMQRRRD